MQLVENDPPSDVLQEAQTIIQAFDENMPLSARVEWALADDRARGLIDSWQPESTLAAILKVCGESPATGGMQYKTFLRCMDCMVGAGIKPLNPIVADAVTFMEALAESQWDFQGSPSTLEEWREWVPDLQRLALVHKFKLEPDPRPRDELFAGGPECPTS